MADDEREKKMIRKGDDWAVKNDAEWRANKRYGKIVYISIEENLNSTFSVLLKLGFVLLVILLEGLLES